MTKKKIVMTMMTVVALCAAVVGWQIHRKGWTQIVTGVPHVPQGCDTRSHPILVIGQSQASNTGPARSRSRIQSFALDQGHCYHLRDPMPGTGGRGGSVWPRFADALDQPVTIVDLAISGSAIEQWTTPDQLGKIRAALADFKAKGFAAPTIIWMQGETNAARHDTADHYAEQLRTILQTAPTNRWIITRESICTDIDTPSAALNLARDRIAAQFPSVTIGPDLDTIPLADRQPDRCHMTPAGQDRIARQLAATFARLHAPIASTPATGLARLGL